jgi:hypothetical protein
MTKAKSINQSALYDNLTDIRPNSKQTTSYQRGETIVVLSLWGRSQPNQNQFWTMAKCLSQGPFLYGKLGFRENGTAMTKYCWNVQKVLLAHSGRWYHWLFHPEKKEFSWNLGSVSGRRRINRYMCDLLNYRTCFFVLIAFSTLILSCYGVYPIQIK